MNEQTTFNETGEIMYTLFFDKDDLPLEFRAIRHSDLNVEVEQRENGYVVRNVPERWVRENAQNPTRKFYLDQDEDTAELERTIQHDGTVITALRKLNKAQKKLKEETLLPIVGMSASPFSQEEAEKYMQEMVAQERTTQTNPRWVLGQTVRPWGNEWESGHYISQKIERHGWTLEVRWVSGSSRTGSRATWGWILTAPSGVQTTANWKGEALV